MLCQGNTQGDFETFFACRAQNQAVQLDIKKNEKEKKKHREELYMIRTMISDREEQSDKDEKLSQEHEDDIEDKATRQYEG